ncbi:hypothetical protein MJO28_014164 [Puccinia striiformis f. sp. tritici]|uniref:Uncharacterized protein n=1 Tax=Puccinia striiformis f. sp. tritici TaxID=168172 RepID=A0ACC0DSQ9_9BASI|nr:hypothetical protein MJO28_014164 [Puccinia striiformis f. sp. tritici]
MSAIPSTQSTQTNALQQTPNTETQSTTQTTTTQTTQPATQQTPVRGRGSWGGRRGAARGGGRRSRAGSRGATPSGKGTRSAHRSWTNNQNRDGLSTLDLIVEWLTVEGHYNLWRNSGVSKREVAEIINEYVIANGGESRVWRGIDQQITSLETKFRVALAYRDQTGQGILDKAEERARQAGGDPEDSDTEDFVGDAITQTEAQIRKRCKYFYELEPVMLNRPSATPLDTHEQGEGNDDLAQALNLGNEDRPTTPDHWSESERGGNASPVNTLGQPSPDLTQTLPSVAQPSRAQGSTTTTPLGSGTPPVAPSPSAWAASMSAIASQRPDPQSQRRVSYAERITDRLFPSREDMAAQSAAEIQLNRERLDADTRMVDANIELANAIRQGLAPTVSPPETTTLQRRQLELNVQLREVEIARARAALEAERATGAAFARAKMIQDFMRAGLSPDDALRFTNDTLASAPPNPLGSHGTDDSVIGPGEPQVDIID